MNWFKSSTKCFDFAAADMRGTATVYKFHDFSVTAADILGTAI